MRNFTDLQNSVKLKLAALDREEADILRRLFEWERQDTLNCYLQLIRLRRQEAEYNRMFPNAPRWPEPPLHDQCEAAVLILTFAEPDIQKMFLAADNSGRSRMIQSVVDDGGILYDGNKWQEMLP